MDAQAFANPTMTFQLMVAESSMLTVEEPIYADPRDYGFDFDPEELAGELLAPVPYISAAKTISEVKADEFEKVFQYFLS